MVTLQFPNSDVVDVLRYYENLTSKKLIMDNFVQGKVNIALSRPVPRDEAVKIIEMNLLMNGYSLVPAGDDIVKVIGTGRSRATPGCRWFPMKPTFPRVNTSSASSSNCTMPIRSSFSRCSGNIFSRRRLTRRSWRCPKRPPF